MLSPGGTVILPATALFSALCSGSAHGAAFTLGLHRVTSQEALGWREPTDLDTGLCFGLQDIAGPPKQALVGLTFGNNTYLNSISRLAFA